jgi:hypothetical protein
MTRSALSGSNLIPKEALKVLPAILRGESALDGLSDNRPRASLALKTGAQRYRCVSGRSQERLF